MKRNRKKVTSAIALTLSAMLCLSACGEKAATGEKEKTSSQDVSAATEQEETKPYWELLDQVSDTSELPDWTGETLEITIWFAAGTAGMTGEIPETDVAYKEFERVTGVKFNLDESFDNGGNNIDAKLPMVIASNDLPTIILGYDIDKQMRELYDEGYLADLTEYYNNGDLDQLLQWLPLEEMEDRVYSAAKTEAGEYYLLPQGDGSMSVLTNVYNATGYTPEIYDKEYYANYGKTPQSATGMSTGHTFYVRDDILKALKPDALTRAEIEQIYMENGTYTEEQIYAVDLNSRDEFFEFLRDVKALIADGSYVGLDGAPVEVTYGPHMETDNWFWMVYMPNLLDGIPWGTDYFCSADRTATAPSDLLQKAYLSDYYVDYMKDLNALVREDVISQNSLLDNRSIFTEKTNNGHYAVVYVNGDIQQVNGGDEWSYTPIWVNAPYNADFGGFSTANYAAYYGIFKDTLSDEQLDQLIHAINYLNSVVGMNNFYWGPETAGLFTEDADGNRTYIDEELLKCMLENEDNGAAKKYGLMNNAVSEGGFGVRPQGIAYTLLAPKYLAAGNAELNVINALTYYNPGILSGQSLGENSIYLSDGCEVYGSLGTQVDGLNQFWSARNGFENQLKKVIVADSEADFEKQLEELKIFAEENGFTDEALAEFNDLFVEANEDALRSSGLID